MADMKDDALPMVLGNEKIDADHHAFFLKIKLVGDKTDSEFVALFFQIHQHLIDHFSYEDNLMEQCQFSARTEHQAEHRRILGEMNQFQKRVDRGRVSMARSYLCDTLPAWFKLHLLTMDSALVAQAAKIEQVS